MTRSRTSTTRELFGMLGKFEDGSRVQAEWNRFFEGQEMDAFMDRYPTTEENLSERLSEMFHFDRRGYIVGKSLYKAIIPLLDRLDSSAEKEGRVDMVVNERGVMVGYFLKEDCSKNTMLTLWCFSNGGNPSFFSGVL